MGLGNLATLTTLGGGVETKAQGSGLKSDQDRRWERLGRTSVFRSLAVKGASPRGHMKSQDCFNTFTFNVLIF